MWNEQRQLDLTPATQGRPDQAGPLGCPTCRDKSLGSDVLCPVHDNDDQYAACGRSRAEGQPGVVLGRMHDNGDYRA